MNTLTIEALSVASAIESVRTLPHGTRAHVILTERGAPWAELNISDMTDTRVAVFPTLPGCSATGDTRKAGETGVHYSPSDAAHTHHALSVVINRARRMHSKYGEA